MTKSENEIRELIPNAADGERSARILVVEDEPSIRELVLLVLSRHGYEAIGAASGAEALLRATEDPVDLVLLDVMLGEMTGWEVLEEINRRGLRGRTKVVMLTAQRAETDILRGWSLGVDEYQTKPFDVDELLETVRGVLSSPGARLRDHCNRELAKTRVLAAVEAAFNFAV